MNKLFFASLFLISLNFALAQSNSIDEMFDQTNNDMNIGGDIFNDFNEDLEASQILEDERFYKYSRFFSFNIGLGITRFTGNRGKAYTKDNDPTFHLSFTYFMTFQTAWSLGLEYSRHTQNVSYQCVSCTKDSNGIGNVEVSFIRPFYALRYYFDTTNYGNAITYSNPHLVGRLEYWYQTNKFKGLKGIDPSDNLSNFQDQSGGGIGAALGFGLDFPVKLKETYISVETLWHMVNFFDKEVSDWKGDPSTGDSNKGVNDLTGNSWTVVVTYNATW